MLLWLSLALADPTVGGEVIPGGPLELPVLLEQAALHYPEAALAEGLHGSVTVRVHVGEDGAVRDVSVVEGLEIFRVEALRAARRLRFSAATRDGVSVPALIDVYFHFAPPSHDHPEPIYEITVGADADKLDTHARETLSSEDLDRSTGASLAEAVDGVSGVTSASGVADTAKPIIRGQIERRLLLLYDGIRHESQKWGPDHAPEIDPFSAGSVSVVKGAAGVRYGPDAIGGVVLIDPPALRTEAGVSGRAVAQGATNGRRAYVGARLDMAPSDRLALRAEGNIRRSADRLTPDYVLGNTASETYNLGAALEWRPGLTEVRVAWRRYALRAGIFYGVQLSDPGAFDQQLAYPLGADQWTSGYRIERPQQRVVHDLLSVRVSQPLGSYGALTTTYALQLNQREELEQVRDAIEGPQYDFSLRTHSLDVVATQHTHALGDAAAEGGGGLQVVFQENVYRGLALVPNYRSLAVGAHLWERLSFKDIALEGGLRYDHVGRTAFLTENAWERHNRRGTLAGVTCTFVGNAASCPRGFDLASVTVGSVWEAVEDTVAVKLDLSNASRVPNTDEQWLNGSAPSFPVFALGSPSLPVETSWSVAPTLGVSLPWLEAEVSPYGSLIQNYVLFAPELGDAGQPLFETTIRGAFPRYRFSPVDAWFYGTDAAAEIFPEGRVGATVRGACVRAREVGTGEHLVGIVSDRLAVIGHARPGKIGPLSKSWVDVSLSGIGRQSRVDPSLDFAPPPDGAWLLGAALGIRIETARGEVDLSLHGTNLTQTRYRTYTSLLRYYADSPGRDIRLRVGMSF
jgi:iron complex outermembrane receptor protein